jgi:alanine racemase
MPRVTINDIAEKAGVSKTAVSFAFNKPEQLSEETLSRILEVAEELGYTPDPTASNLKTRQTGCIGLLMPQPLPTITRNPQMFAFLEGVTTTFKDAGLSVMLVPPLQGSMRRAVMRAAVDGFLTLGLETFRGTMRVLQQRDVPFVMVDSDPIPGISCVNIDDEAGAYVAMAHVVRSGHQQIAMLGIRSGQHGHYEEYAGTLKRRIAGYVRALAERGLSIDGEHVRLIECECEIDGGADAFRALWKGRWRPTAVLAMADVIALGVLEAAQALGVSVPEDVSIVGYDDIPAARLVCPALTTIRQPSTKKGESAAGLLLQLIQDPQAEPAHITLPVQLIERQSTRNRSS